MKGITKEIEKDGRKKRKNGRNTERQETSKEEVLAVVDISFTGVSNILLCNIHIILFSDGESVHMSVRC